MFTYLDKVALTDEIKIDLYSRTLVYRAVDRSVVRSTETVLLRPQADCDLISLVTCTPIGVNSHRIIVTAERVLPTPADAGKSVDAIGFHWWVNRFGTHSGWLEAALDTGAAVVVPDYGHYPGQHPSVAPYQWNGDCVDENSLQEAMKFHLALTYVPGMDSEELKRQRMALAEAHERINSTLLAALSGCS